MYGDLNGDGMFNTSDYVLLQRYILEIINDFSYSEAKINADVNGDDRISSLDASLFTRKILGIIDAFPVENIIGPSKPTNLQLIKTTNSSATISWTESISDVDIEGYKIYNNNELVGTTTDTSYTVEGLEIFSENIFTVEAFDKNGRHSGKSAPLRVVIDFVLEEDIVIDKDYELGDNTIYLNGFTLTVNGTLKQNSGEINLGEGNLIINGDFIQSGGIVNVESGKLYVKNDYLIEGNLGTASTGILKMLSYNGIVDIEGNFRMASSVDHRPHLKTGIIRLSCWDLKVSG